MVRQSGLWSKELIANGESVQNPTANSREVEATTRHHARSRNRKQARFITQTALATSLALGVAMACSSPRSTSDSSSGARADGNAPPQSWSAKMAELTETLTELLPLISSRARFDDEANFKKIETQTENLRSLAHSLKTDSAPSADPSLQVVSRLFDEDISRALQSLRHGNREYARAVLRDTTSYCIQCHTQSNNGPDFPRLNLAINTDALSPLDRAEFFAATRQFEPAIETYEQVLNDQALAESHPYAWEQAARNALAIVVRVKRDPQAAAELLKIIARNRAKPKPMEDILTAWKHSVREWQNERTPPPANEKDKLALAEKLIGNAQYRQDFPLDHAQDVAYFRAASLLSEILSSTNEPNQLRTRALYLAGVAAEATRDMNFWTLHETYYERCIRQAPHTKQALQCYNRLNDSIVLGYSGSGGVNIPAEVMRRLESLRTQAEPKK